MGFVKCHVALHRIGGGAPVHCVTLHILNSVVLLEYSEWFSAKQIMKNIASTEIN